VRMDLLDGPGTVSRLIQLLRGSVEAGATYHAPGDPELQAEGGLMKVAVRSGIGSERAIRNLVRSTSMSITAFPTTTACRSTRNTGRGIYWQLRPMPGRIHWMIRQEHLRDRRLSFIMIRAQTMATRTRISGIFLAVPSCIYCRSDAASDSAQMCPDPWTGS
jgi:hypothetical protein